MLARGSAPRVFSVAELSAAIRGALERTVGHVWVSGEISGWKRAASGHCYFTLKDDEAQLAAVMFRGTAGALVFEPADGMAVVLLARVDLYGSRGTLQLYVEDIEPLGVGALRVAFDQLKAALEREGLFAPARKRPLPAYPRVVGLVTALTGAAVHDMRVVLARRWPLARVLIRPVRVQGDAAPAEIAQGIADLDAAGDVDVMIVGRGGGSLEDLWAFNTEAVARAIAGARTPVVSAVGHEVDVTIADYVADARAATPTAGAAMVVPDRETVRDDVAALVWRLESALEHLVEARRGRLVRAVASLTDPRRRLRPLAQRLDELAERARLALARRAQVGRRELAGLAHRLERASPQGTLRAIRGRVENLGARLPRAMGERSRAARGHITRAGATLAALSPLACLERGYAIVRRREDNGIVRDAAALSPGDAVTLVLARGRATARIDDTEEG